MVSLFRGFKQPVPRGAYPRSVALEAKEAQLGGEGSSYSARNSAVLDEEN